MAYNRKLTGFTDRDCDTAVSNSEPTTTTSPESTSVIVSTATPVTQTAVTTAQMTTTTSAESTTQTDAPSTLRSELRDARKRKWHADDLHSDYLLVPDGFYSQRFFASKYCNRSLEDFDVRGTFSE